MLDQGIGRRGVTDPAQGLSRFPLGQAVKRPDERGDRGRADLLKRRDDLPRSGRVRLHQMFQFRQTVDPDATKRTKRERGQQSVDISALRWIGEPRQGLDRRGIARLTERPDREGTHFRVRVVQRRQ